MPTIIQSTILTPKVNQATKERREEETWGIPMSTYASGLDECLRMQFYKRKGFPEFNPNHLPAWTRNATTGNAMHDSYQDLFKRAGLVARTSEVLDHAGFKLEDFSERVQIKGLPEFAEELPIPVNDYGIGGKCDGIHRVTADIDLGDKVLHIDNSLVVVEIKTMKEKYFKNIPNNYKWRGYYSQIQLYMHFFKLEWTILFAVNRNDDDIKELWVRYDPEFVAERLNRALTIRSHVETNTIPVAEISFKNCMFCPFKDYCAIQIMEDDGENVIYVEKKDE